MSCLAAGFCERMNATGRLATEPAEVEAERVEAEAEWAEVDVEGSCKSKAVMHLLIAFACQVFHYSSMHKAVPMCCTEIA